MVIARVVGNMVSTIKHDKHVGMKLMMVECIDFDGNPIGTQQIAVDCACSGVGDIVLVNTDGGAANMIYGDATGTTPIDWAICGVIDHVFVEDKQLI